MRQRLVRRLGRSPGVTAAGFADAERPVRKPNPELGAEPQSRRFDAGSSQFGACGHFNTSLAIDNRRVATSGSR